VTVDPLVAPAMVAAVLLTWIVQVAVCPCVNVPVCDLVIDSTGAGLIVGESEGMCLQSYRRRQT